jgi:ribosomal-protein-alanine N-acetyltransferase
MLGEKHIGTIMLFNFNHDAKNVEIGYVLSKDYWHKGYTGEAVTLLMDYLKDHTDTHKVYARVVNTNVGSSKVLENYGFKLEGYQVDQYFIENKYYDALHYGYII